MRRGITAIRTVALELKGGKCNLSMGPMRLPCTHQVDGDKVTLSPTEDDKSQTIVLTLKDGALVGPPGGLITKLKKVKELQDRTRELAARAKKPGPSACLMAPVLLCRRQFSGSAEGRA